MPETAPSDFESRGGAGQGQESSGQAGSMKEQAKQKAEEVKSEAESMARSRAEQGTSQAGEQIMTTAQDLRSMSDTLRERGRGGAAQVVEQTAGQAERLANYLRSNDVDTIYRDTQEFARRQPWTVALGGFAVGILAARFMKASGEPSGSAAGQHQPQGGQQQQYFKRHYIEEPYSEPSYSGIADPRHLRVVPDQEAGAAQEPSGTEQESSRPFGSSEDEELQPGYGTDTRSGHGQS